MKKFIEFKNFRLCISEKYIKSEIENIKKYCLSKNRQFWIIKNDRINSFNIYEFNFRFKNFKNFSIYEKFIKENPFYKKDLELFNTYKKQNLNWFYDPIKNSNKRIYKLFE